MTDTAATLFINGAWEPAASGAVRQIRNPADGELVTTVSEAGRADTERAITAARAA
ncbi:aldehyde dehydrogenase, partial [Arthrobacter crystallopoietes BAB-32]